MEKRILKIIAWFFVLLAVMTLICRKLDGMTTPRVRTVRPESGVVAGVYSDCVLPRECVVQIGNKQYVYLLERTDSYFKPLIARQTQVSLDAETAEQAAVSGFWAGDAQVVCDSESSLMGSTVAVRLWEETE